MPLRVRNWYKRVADKFLKPLLLRPEAQTNDKMLDTFEVLQTQDAMLLVKGKNLMVPDITFGGEDEKGHVNPTFVMVGSSYQQGRKESQKNTLSTGHCSHTPLPPLTLKKMFKSIWVEGRDARGSLFFASGRGRRKKFWGRAG